MLSPDFFARTAQDMFIEASSVAPASGTAQAALIAERSRKLSLPIPFLGNALANDNERLAYISKLAAENHIRSGKGPVGVSVQSVKGIVEQDFEFAGFLLKAAPTFLEEIYTQMYQNARGTDRIEYAVRWAVFRRAPMYKDLLFLRYGRRALYTDI